VATRAHSSLLKAEVGRLEQPLCLGNRSVLALRRCGRTMRIVLRCVLYVVVHCGTCEFFMMSGTLAASRAVCSSVSVTAEISAFSITEAPGSNA